MINRFFQYLCIAFLAAVVGLAFGQRVASLVADETQKGFVTALAGAFGAAIVMPGLLWLAKYLEKERLPVDCPELRRKFGIRE